MDQNKKWDAKESYPITRTPYHHPHNNLYYYKCMVGGVLSCGLTHFAMTPFDVLKCKNQVNSQKYKNLRTSASMVMKEEGVRGFTIGGLPTLIGYSMQGLCKYGFYEFFKDFYANLAGEENAYHYKPLIWCLASASAEFFADIALCPMEMVKVKIQTSPLGTWPNGFVPAVGKMITERATTKYPYGSILPLWGRQIPYTVTKFFFFERFVQAFYDHIFTEPKESYSKRVQLSITFASGYLAGVLCALVSHPADNLVSQMAKPDNSKKGIVQIGRELGFYYLMTKGLGTRIFMIGTLTALQWWIYDSFKASMGIETTGGGSEKH